MTLNYYKNLDGIRAIAALMVMFFHFFSPLSSGSKALQFISKISVFGQTGVTLFFVLSGFLITRILLHTKNKKGYFRNFYVRRTLRIFPLYYLFLVVFYYLVPLLTNTEKSTINEQLYYFTYLQNFAITFKWNAFGPEHFWSLAVEEHFYLFWPLIIYFFSRKNINTIIYAIIVFAFILRFYMALHNYKVFYFTFTRFDALAIGSLLALLELKNVFKPENVNKFLLSLGIIFIPTIAIWTVFTGGGNLYIQVFKYLFLSFTYFCLIGFTLCISQNHIINQLLKTKFFSYTGKISYGLYVYHPLIYFICSQLFHIDNIIFDLLTKLLITYIISSLSYYLFESYFLRLKRFFEYKTI